MELTLEAFGHQWEKKAEAKERYWVYQCKNCGILGLLPGSAEKIRIPRIYEQKAVQYCKEPVPEGYVRIVKCEYYDDDNKNLSPGSIHKIIDAPENMKEMPGVWVMGTTEPFRLIDGEYEPF